MSTTVLALFAALIAAGLVIIIALAVVEVMELRRVTGQLVALVRTLRGDGGSGGTDYRTRAEPAPVADLSVIADYAQTGGVARATAPPKTHRLDEVVLPPPPDRLVEGPAIVGGYHGDSVKDWLQHFTFGRRTWPDAVAEFYHRASRDPEIADYFGDADMGRLAEHFTRAMILLTGKGLRQSVVDRMGVVHASVRNSRGQAITPEIYDRVVSILVGILRQWNVPPAAIDDLARIITPVRAAVLGQPVRAR